MLEVAAEDRATYTEIWKRVQPETNFWFEPTVIGALNTAKTLSKDYASMQTLITGSQHLVGSALSLLQTSENS